MDFLRFLGKPEQKIVDYCQEHKLPYKVVLTKDPRAAADSVTEKKVIRLDWNQDTLIILVGCFAPATYDRRN